MYVCEISQESSRIPCYSSWKSLQKESQIISIEAVLSSEMVWKKHVKICVWFILGPGVQVQIQIRIKGD